MGPNDSASRWAVIKAEGDPCPGMPHFSRRVRRLKKLLYILPEHWWLFSMISQVISFRMTP
jgi:hypothetical protein